MFESAVQKMATTQVETVNTGADKAKLAAAGALVIVALAAFYMLGKQGALVQWAVLLVGLAAAVGVFFCIRNRAAVDRVWKRCVA